MPGLPAPEDVAAAARLADLLAAASLVDRALPQPLQTGNIGRQLRIVFLLSRAEAGGGAGVLLEQADQLAREGATVSVVSRFPAPSWFPARASYVQVPFGEPIEDAVPPCDLIVAGHWEFVLPARRLGLAPVVHLEQGDFHLYESVPEQVGNVISASVRAAHATFALGSQAVRALGERFGVEAVEVGAAVDNELYRPTDAASDRRRSVVLIGWDGPRTWALEDARAIVNGLAESHPDVRAVLITSAPPIIEVPGEVVIAPTREELVEIYQAADVCVSCSRDGASALVPLKAMAAGVPVVATATAGVTDYCSDGKNALIVPIGEVVGLTDRVRHVLDDPELAQRLSKGGLKLASRHSWTRKAAELLSRYGDVVTEVRGIEPNQPVLGSFALSLEGVRFDRPEHEALLGVRLRTCTTRELAIPVAQPAVAGHHLFRWKTVAWRDDGEPGVTRAYLPARSEALVTDSPYQAGIEMLRRRRGNDALDYFVARCEAGSRPEQAVLGRWIVLALLAAKRPADAADVAVAFARDFPSHPDYLYLGVVAALAAHRPIEIAGPLEGIRLLGQGGRHEEWFDDPAALLSAHLAAA